MSSKIYWTSIEYRYIKKVDKKDLKGGFVYAFINANDVRDVLKKVLIELAKQNLEPIEIEFISPYDKEMEWETKEQTEHFKQLYKESKKTDNVVFDDFYAYKTDLEII